MIEKAKQLAAQAAINNHIIPLLERGRSYPLVVGIGSGSTITHAIRHLHAAYTSLSSSDRPALFCIPTSFQSRQLLLDLKLPVADIDQVSTIHVTIDGADEVDPSLNLIKGGGGCHFQEKLVASYSEELVIIADDRKMSRQLGVNWRKGVPVEVVPAALNAVQKALQKAVAKNLLPYETKCVLRDGSPSKAGPCVTDNGNFILDVDVGPIQQPSQLNSFLKSQCGVLETGLFIGMAQIAYFGCSNGDVKVWKAGEDNQMT